tara:strand:+ start:474 stop:2075 length:1602 start_codon:yes stop_codon:yes gene_type:complete
MKWYIFCIFIGIYLFVNNIDRFSIGGPNSVIPPPPPAPPPPNEVGWRELTLDQRRVLRSINFTSANWDTPHRWSGSPFNQNLSQDQVNELFSLGFGIPWLNLFYYNSERDRCAGGGGAGGAGGAGGGGAGGGGAGGGGGGCQDLPAEDGSDWVDDDDHGCSAYEEGEAAGRNWCSRHGGSTFGDRGNANTHCCICSGGVGGAGGTGGTGGGAGGTGDGGAAGAAGAAGGGPIQNLYYLLIPGNSIEQKWGSNRVPQNSDTGIWQTFIENKIIADTNASLLYDTINGDWSRISDPMPCVAIQDTNRCHDGLPVNGRNYPRIVFNLYNVLVRLSNWHSKPDRSIIIYATSNGGASLFYVLKAFFGDEDFGNILLRIRTIFLFDPSYKAGDNDFYRAYAQDESPDDEFKGIADYVNEIDSTDPTVFNFLDGINVIIFNACGDRNTTLVIANKCETEDGSFLSIPTRGAMQNYMDITYNVVTGHRVQRTLRDTNHSGDLMPPPNIGTTRYDAFQQFWNSVYDNIKSDNFELLEQLSY